MDAHRISTWKLCGWTPLEVVGEEGVFQHFINKSRMRQDVYELHTYLFTKLRLIKHVSHLIHTLFSVWEVL